MTLPKGFVFSQSNLQDYVDCQRRFQLRHILHQSWPAVEAEPYLENEHLMDQGNLFHKIVRQHLIGISEDQIVQTISADDTISMWWNHYITSTRSGALNFIFEPGNQRFEETTLSVGLGDFRLIAKYDLLLHEPEDKLVIFDWKTSRNHPKRRWLADRLQTHVYPFVLAGAISGLLPDFNLDPDQIEMVYWFANQPEQLEHFIYNQSSLQEDGRYLNDLITAINLKSEADFPLTPDVRRCLFCTYRSLCNRGVEPGDLEHLEEWQEPEVPDEVSVDYDQIGEIDY